MFKNKTLLITGGTGSFGHAVLDRYLNSDIGEIRIFSRDENKQDLLRKKYLSTKIKFYIGDVRDYNSFVNASKDVDYIFHAAALKQVPSCEFYPLEALKTNVLGASNVADAAINNKVKKVVFLSTDKAVYPINSMGLTKSLMEKVITSKARESENTMLCTTRYGNVMGSRGSVIPLFLDQVINNKPLTVTNPDMTRFMMSMDDAIDLVLFAFDHGEGGDVIIQKSPAATVKILAEAICNLFNKSNHDIDIIGTRHGEKLYEVLMSKEERSVSVDLDKYYKIPPDLRDLNYNKFIDSGKNELDNQDEYSSHNTERLDVQQMEKLLLNLKEIQKILKEK